MWKEIRLSHGIMFLKNSWVFDQILHEAFVKLQLRSWLTQDLSCHFSNMNQNYQLKMIV